VQQNNPEILRLLPTETAKTFDNSAEISAKTAKTRFFCGYVFRVASEYGCVIFFTCCRGLSGRICLIFNRNYCLN